MDARYPEHPDEKRRATLRRAAASLTETAGRALLARPGRAGEGA
ncbi:DUF6380 family protein [Streptomyces sp. R02]|uniref:DUF6380 family protein n=1 Tax=Streptomyces sp. R02 TaxID=3238623 RepID=A0AB39LT79_9ACTN